MKIRTARPNNPSPAAPQRQRIGDMQREVFYLLAATPLSLQELSEIRGWKPKHMWNWLQRQEGYGFVRRCGTTHKAKKRGRQYQTLYVLTGKPFDAPDPSPALQLQLSHALAFRDQCAVRSLKAALVNQ